MVPLSLTYVFREVVAGPGLRDLDDIVLTAAVIADDGAVIPAGTEGTIVSVDNSGETYTVEFAEPEGTLATLELHEMRRVARDARSSEGPTE